MISKRITVKFFAENADIPALTAFTPVFHRWIQQSAVPGLLIDVADYKHVVDGPGVVLIGHEGDYAFDLQQGQPGLLYRGKRGWSEANDASPVQGRLRQAIERALAAVVALEAEPSLDPPLRFRGDVLEIQFIDRLHTPNQAEVAERLAEDVAVVLNRLYAGQDVEITRRNGDPRRPLTLRVEAAIAPRPQVLLENLSRAVAAPVSEETWT